MTEYKVREFQIFNAEQEVHFPAENETVAVCWNLKELENDDGSTYWEKTDDPYIDFIWLKEDSDGTHYKDEDSPVDGGLSSVEAREIAAEILVACDYLESLD